MQFGLVAVPHLLFFYRAVLFESINLEDELHFGHASLNDQDSIPHDA